MLGSISSFGSASVVHQRACVRHSVRALCALRQLGRRAAAVQSRSAASKVVGGHTQQLAGMRVSQTIGERIAGSRVRRVREPLAFTGTLAIESAGARARRGSSQASRNAGRRRRARAAALAAILELTFFWPILAQRACATTCRGAFTMSVQRQVMA